MKQVKMLLFFMMTFSMLIVGCTNISIPDNNISEPSNSDVSVTEDVFVSVDYATDELINKYDTVEGFEDEGYQKIIFTTNIAVKNFKFIEISYKDEDMNIKFFENKVLYSLDELLPEKPFVVTWMEQGTIPNRGVTFEDESGTTRYFYLTMSGKDGSILLVEFQ